MTRLKAIRYAGTLVAAVSIASVAQAQEIAGRAAVVAASSGDSVDLAKKLSNPISDLISLPFRIISMTVTARTETASRPISTSSRSFRSRSMPDGTSSRVPSCRSSAKTA